MSILPYSSLTSFQTDLVRDISGGQISPALVPYTRSRANFVDKWDVWHPLSCLRTFLTSFAQKRWGHEWIRDKERECHFTVQLFYRHKSVTKLPRDFFLSSPGQAIEKIVQALCSHGLFLLPAQEMLSQVTSKVSKENFFLGNAMAHLLVMAGVNVQEDDPHVVCYLSALEKIKRILLLKMENIDATIQAERSAQKELSNNVNKKICAYNTEIFEVDTVTDSDQMKCYNKTVELQKCLFDERKRFDQENVKRNSDRLKCVRVLEVFVKMLETTEFQNFAVSVHSVMNFRSAEQIEKNRTLAAFRQPLYMRYIIVGKDQIIKDVIVGVVDEDRSQFSLYVPSVGKVDYLSKKSFFEAIERFLRSVDYTKKHVDMTVWTKDGLQYDGPTSVTPSAPPPPPPLAGIVSN